MSSSTIPETALDGLLLSPATLNVVRAGLEAAAKTHPGLTLDGASLGAMVSRLIARGGDAAALCWEDLYLAEAALEGDSAAWARLKALHGYRLASVFRRT